MSQSLLAPAAVNGRDWLILHATDRKCFEGASSSTCCLVSGVFLRFSVTEGTKDNHNEVKLVRRSVDKPRPSFGL